MTSDKKVLLLQLVFSVLAVVTAMLQVVRGVCNFKIEEVFWTIVVPIFVAMHSWRFVASQPIWSRCFVQIIEVVLEPIDVIR